MLRIYWRAIQYLDSSFQIHHRYADASPSSSHPLHRLRPLGVIAADAPHGPREDRYAFPPSSRTHRNRSTFRRCRDATVEPGGDPRVGASVPAVASGCGRRGANPCGGKRILFLLGPNKSLPQSHPCERSNDISLAGLRPSPLTRSLVRPIEFMERLLACDPGLLPVGDRGVEEARRRVAEDRGAGGDDPISVLLMRGGVPLWPRTPTA